MGYLVYIGTSCAIVTLIFGLFGLAERVAQEDARIKASLWLLDLELGKGFHQGAMQFAALFDSIYGKNHFSYKCFYLSCFTSTLAVLIITVIVYLINPEKVYAIHEKNTLLWIIVLGIAINYLPDYFSLLETRWIIKKMGHSPSIYRLVSLLFIDILLSVLIFSLLAPLFSIFSAIMFAEEFPSVIHYLMLVKVLSYDAARFSGDSLKYGVYFWTTFFTSFWIWIYLLGIGVIRFSRILGFGWKFLRDSFLNIEDKPYESMGFVTSSTVLIILLVGGGIYQVIF